MNQRSVIHRCLVCRKPIEPDASAVRFVIDHVQVYGGQDVKQPETRYLHLDHARGAPRSYRETGRGTMRDI